MAALTLLQTRGLTRDFGGLRAVDNVDFELTRGEVRAVIGPNGAGKTTFVGLLSGRIAPTSGQVQFDGRDVTRLPAHRRVRLGMGYTFQITSVFGALTLRQNVSLAAQHHHHGAALDRAVAAALRHVGLDTDADLMAGTQSYGHQRLLELAMGLALEPRLLILDEPTQGLAEDEIARFIDLCRDLSQRMTLLLIEHNMDVVMALADRITVLDSGRVLAEGAPDEIRADAAVQRAYLGG